MVASFRPKFLLLLLSPAMLAGCKQDIGELLRDVNRSATANNYKNPAPLPKSDINGDGYADIVVGAQAGGDPFGSGIAYVLYGSATGINPPAANNCTYPTCTELENPEDENSGGFNSFASAYAIAGDVNGDGFADVVIGAANNGVANNPAGLADNRGAIYVFYGSASGITAFPLDVGTSTYPCSSVANGCTMMQNPENAQGAFGAAVSAAGDVNGDGYADIIVGASQNSSFIGKAYIVYGSATGISYRPFTGTNDTCGAPACTEISDPQNTNGFGYRVSAAGDLNGDGFADISVSALNSWGLVTVYYGSASGIAARATGGYACTALADGCAEILNPRTNSGFGNALSAADFNRDGFSDLIVGAYQNADGAPNSRGAVYIYYGSSTGVEAHLLANGAYACSGACAEIRNPTDDNFGQFGISVSSAGDLNRDGYADLVVGAHRNFADAASDNRGNAYVFYGSSSGLTAHPYGTPTYGCTGFPDCTLMRNPRDENNALFGCNVAAAGDVNADGYADVWIGASGAGPASEGVATVFYGSSGGTTYHGRGAGTGYTCSGPVDCSEVINPRPGLLGKFGAMNQ